MQDLEVFKQIPGYKAILKAVLKNQIQSLVQQLSQQTGEESVLITASMEEGTLSQLGSECGKTFLEDHDEIKSQFLGFCIKRRQVQKQTKEFQASHSSKRWSGRRSHSVIPSNLKRSHPYQISRANQISHNSLKPDISHNSLKSELSHNATEPELSHNAMKSEICIKHEEPEFAEDFVDRIDEVKYSDNSSVLKNEVKDEPEESSGDDERLMVVEAESSPSDVDEVADNLEESHSDLKNDVQFEINTDDIEYVYSGIDDANNLSDEQELVEEALDLKVNCQSSNDSYDTEKNENFETNGNHTTASNQDDTALNYSSCDLGGTEKSSIKLKLKLFNQTQCVKSEKSLKERKLELENYLNLDNPDRPYPCNLCPKRFKERHHLVYHLRTHSGHRPYVCSVCNKTFTQSSSLNTHKKLHLKDMSCDYCGKVFRKITLLQNHVCSIEG